MRRRDLPPLLCALATVVTGCGAVEAAPDVTGSRTASVRVVVWSAELQRAVPAEGTLTARGDGTARPFDTRADAAEGASFVGLAPGAYRVQVHRRFEPGGRAQRVDGAEDIYLEPGQRLDVTVIVTDREGELGGRVLRPGTRFCSSSPATSWSHLPRAATRPVGPG